MMDDTELFLLINSFGRKFPYFDDLMLSLSDPSLAMAIPLIWALVLLVRHYVRGDLAAHMKAHIIAPFLVVLSIGLADSISFRLIKPAFGRFRPCYALTEARIIPVRCGSDFGFPSNHAANMAALAVSLKPFLGAKTFSVLLVFAFAVSISRVYLGVHYPFDIFGGWLVGAVSAGAVLGLFRFLKGSPLRIKNRS